MPAIQSALCALVGGYLVGSVSFAWLIGRLNGIDIREHGSGNVGATNIQRVLGKEWGRLCFVLDFAKGAVPVWIAQACAGAEFAWVPVVAGAAAVAGHVWPITLHFKGGKGFATSLGVIAALAPLCFVVAALVWLGVFFATRYVSLASILAAVALPLAAAGLHPFPALDIAPSVHALLWAIAGLIVVRHKSNIQRLLNGTEHRFGERKEQAGENEDRSA